MGALVKARIHLSTAREVILTRIAPLLIAIILCGSGQLQAQDAAVVLLEPQTLSLGQGQTSSVVVRIEEAANVYGVQLELSFDAGIIKVLDENEAKPGVQISAGDFLAVDEGFEADNNVNNETGQLTYTLSLLAPAEPASGAGTLVEFEVEALESGGAVLQLVSIILASPNGTQLPVQVGDGREDDSPIIVPTTAATIAAPPAATAVQDAPNTPTATAENDQTEPSPTGSATEAPAAPTGSAQSTRSAPETETALPASAEDLAGSTLPPPPPIEEPDLAQASLSTAGPAEAEPLTELAAAAPSPEQSESVAAAGQPLPALTVIGQNPNLQENPALAATPAPAAAGEDSTRGLYFAFGLLFIVIGLIAIWFLWRLRSENRFRNQ